MKAGLCVRHLPGRFVLTATLMMAALATSGERAFACACCDTYQVVNVANWDVLNVREGPGTDYRVVGGLRPGEACIALNGPREGNWVHIDANNSGISGWVNERFLAYYSGPEAPRSSSPARCAELKRLCFDEGSNWGCDELEKSDCPR